MASAEDTPQARARIVRLFLILTPVSFVLGFLLAILQRAAWPYAALIGAVGALGCLICAGAYQLMGPASKNLLYIASAGLALIAFLLRH